MRGEIGRALGEPEVDFRRWLDRALNLSQKQKARSLELRATMALYRCQAGPERGDLRDRLSTLCRGFDEGHDTRDQQDARALLES